MDYSCIRDSGTSDQWWHDCSLTPDDLANHCSPYTLATNAATATVLQNLSEKFLNDAKKIQSSLNNLTEKVNEVNTEVFNVTNSFFLLSNSQYIENIISPDEDEVNEHSSFGKIATANKDVLATLRCAIQVGIDLANSAYSKHEISDSETDDDSLGPLHIYKPINTYAIPLPHIIGSSAFDKDDSLGIAAVLSLSETDRLSESDSEESDTFIPSSSYPVVKVSVSSDSDWSETDSMNNTSSKSLSRNSKKSNYRNEQAPSRSSSKKSYSSVDFISDSNEEDNGLFSKKSLFGGKLVYPGKVSDTHLQHPHPKTISGQRKNLSAGDSKISSSCTHLTNKPVKNSSLFDSDSGDDSIFKGSIGTLRSTSSSSTSRKNFKKQAQQTSKKFLFSNSSTSDEENNLQRNSVSSSQSAASVSVSNVSFHGKENQQKVPAGGVNIFGTNITQAIQTKLKHGQTADTEPQEAGSVFPSGSNTHKNQLLPSENIFSADDLFGTASKSQVSKPSSQTASKLICDKIPPKESVIVKGRNSLFSDSDEDYSYARSAEKTLNKTDNNVRPSSIDVKSKSNVNSHIEKGSIYPTKKNIPQTKLFDSSSSDDGLFSSKNSNKSSFASNTSQKMSLASKNDSPPSNKANPAGISTKREKIATSKSKIIKSENNINRATSKSIFGSSSDEDHHSFSISSKGLYPTEAKLQKPPSRSPKNSVVSTTGKKVSKKSVQDTNKTKLATGKDSPKNPCRKAGRNELKNPKNTLFGSSSSDDGNISTLSHSSSLMFRDHNMASESLYDEKCVSVSVGETTSSVQSHLPIKPKTIINSSTIHAVSINPVKKQNSNSKSIFSSSSSDDPSPTINKNATLERREEEKVSGTNMKQSEEKVTKIVKEQKPLFIPPPLPQCRNSVLVNSSSDDTDYALPTKQDSSIERPLESGSVFEPPPFPSEERSKQPSKNIFSLSSSDDEVHDNFFNTDSLYTKAASSSQVQLPVSSNASIACETNSADNEKITFKSESVIKKHSIQVNANKEDVGVLECSNLMNENKNVLETQNTLCEQVKKENVSSVISNESVDNTMISHSISSGTESLKIEGETTSKQSSSDLKCNINSQIVVSTLDNQSNFTVNSDAIDGNCWPKQSSNKQPMSKPVDSKKKPIGGVLLFGGEEFLSKLNERKIMSDSFSGKAEIEPKNDLSKNTIESESTLQSTLMPVITPISRKRGMNEEAAISFDDPVISNTLHCVTKNRPRILRRRLPGKFSQIQSIDSTDSSSRDQQVPETKNSASQNLHDSDSFVKDPSAFLSKKHSASLIPTISNSENSSQRHDKSETIVRKKSITTSDVSSDITEMLNTSQNPCDCESSLEKGLVSALDLPFEVKSRTPSVLSESDIQEASKLNKNKCFSDIFEDDLFGENLTIKGNNPSGSVPVKVSSQSFNSNQVVSTKSKNVVKLEAEDASSKPNKNCSKLVHKKPVNTIFGDDDKVDLFEGSVSSTANIEVKRHPPNSELSGLKDSLKKPLDIESSLEKKVPQKSNQSSSKLCQRKVVSDIFGEDDDDLFGESDLSYSSPAGTDAVPKTVKGHQSSTSQQQTTSVCDKIIEVNTHAFSSDSTENSFKKPHVSSSQHSIDISEDNDFLIGSKSSSYKLRIETTGEKAEPKSESSLPDVDLSKSKKTLQTHLKEESLTGIAIEEKKWSLPGASTPQSKKLVQNARSASMTPSKKFVSDIFGDDDDDLFTSSSSVNSRSEYRTSKEQITTTDKTVLSFIAKPTFSKTPISEQSTVEKTPVLKKNSTPYSLGTDSTLVKRTLPSQQELLKRNNTAVTEKVSEQNSVLKKDITKKTRSLFSDDEDDSLFGASKIEVSNTAGNKVNKKSVSLFDDEDDNDLFSSKPNTTALKKTVANTNRKNISHKASTKRNLKTSEDYFDDPLLSGKK